MGGSRFSFIESKTLELLVDSGGGGGGGGAFQGNLREGKGFSEISFYGQRRIPTADMEDLVSKIHNGTFVQSIR
jgi:hypothetical protein